MDAGERLKYARSFLDINQGEFCQRIGMSHQSYLSDIENNRRPLSGKVANRIEEEFNISSTWLIDGIGEMAVDPNRTKPTVKQNQEAPGDRLRQWRTSKNLSQKEVAEKIGYKQVAISAAENREPKNVADKLANKLEQSFGVSRLWIKEGIGTPEGKLKPVDSEIPSIEKSANGHSKNIVVKSILSASHNNRGEGNMAFVDAVAKAGYVEGLEDPDYVQELPPVRIPGFDEGFFRVFEVSGMSMHDTLFPDDLVICQKIDDPAEIRDDRVHVIVTRNDGVLIKRVLNRLSRSQKLILTSDNNANGNYPPMSIKMKDVLELWYVQGRITRQLPHPNKLVERVRNLEGDIQELIMRLDER